MTSDFISLNVQSSNHSASSKPEHGCHPVLNIAQIIKKKRSLNMSRVSPQASFTWKKMRPHI